METVYIILIWNIIVFLIYGTDKLFARLDMWRISEKTLLSCAIILGGVGALVGMEIWRHKTKHKNFRVIVRFSFLITIAVITYIYKI